MKAKGTYREIILPLFTNKKPRVNHAAFGDNVARRDGGGKDELVATPRR